MFISNNAFSLIIEISENKVIMFVDIVKYFFDVIWIWSDDIIQQF